MIRLRNKNIHLEIMPPYLTIIVGAQWLSGRVLDSRPKGRGFEPHGVTVLFFEWPLKTH